MTELIAKVCSCCQELKPIEEFALRARSADGHQSMCKACRRQYDRERAAELKNSAKQRRANTAQRGTVKYCPACKRDLPLGYFYTNYKNSDGFSFYCRSCTSKKNGGKKTSCKAAEMEAIKYAPHAIGEAEKMDKKALRKCNVKNRKQIQE